MSDRISVVLKSLGHVTFCITLFYTSAQAAVRIVPIEDNLPLSNAEQKKCMLNAFAISIKYFISVWNCAALGW